MRILLIKTSSLGDVVHTLPALTDALRAYPTLQVDWLVEESFATLAAWHPAVASVIPVAIRRWRKAPWRVYNDPAWRRLRLHLSAQHYDLILDAQGLLKSAWLGCLAKGPRAGFDRNSVREKLSGLFYQRTYPVARGQHAVERTRQLFAQALNYALPEQIGDYALARDRVTHKPRQQKTLLFLHGTTWASKHYPEMYWTELAKRANTDGYLVKLPWGNAEEKARAERIAAQSQAQVLPKLSLKEVAEEIACAGGVIAVDSGLGHLACALDTPVIALYGSTNPQLTSTYGRTQQALSVQFACAPCMKKQCQFKGNSVAQPACYDSLAPETVWQILLSRMRLIYTDCIE